MDVSLTRRKGELCLIEGCVCYMTVCVCVFPLRGSVNLYSNLLSAFLLPLLLLLRISLSPPFSFFIIFSFFVICTLTSQIQGLYSPPPILLPSFLSFITHLTLFFTTLRARPIDALHLSLTATDRQIYTPHSPSQT